MSKPRKKKLESKKEFSPKRQNGVRLHLVLGREHSPLGRGRITVQLVSSLTRLELTNDGNTKLFVFCEAVSSNLVKLETSRTVILPPTVSAKYHRGSKKRFIVLFPDVLEDESDVNRLDGSDGSGWRIDRKYARHGEPVFDDAERKNQR